MIARSDTEDRYHVMNCNEHSFSHVRSTSVLASVSLRVREGTFWHLQYLFHATTEAAYSTRLPPIHLPLRHGSDPKDMTMTLEDRSRFREGGRIWRTA